MAAIESALSPGSSSFRTFGLSWPLLVALLTVLGALGSMRFGAVLGDPDTYWHLATGRWILEHRIVPDGDPFSHSMPGMAWTAHEWLSEIVLAGIHQAAGWMGLVVIVALVFAGTLAYVTRFLLSRMEPVHALLFTAFAAGMMMSHLLARPHVLAWPLIAVWVGTLVDAGEHRRGPPWLLLPLMMLWANVHGSFVLGLALGAALAADAVLTQPAGARWAAARTWAVFIGLAVLVAMITPSGLQGVLYPFQVSGMTVALDVIGEWRSPDFHRLQMLELWLMLVLAIACSGRMKLPLLRLILVLGLAHLALKHQRHVPMLGLLSPFLMASALASRWYATKGQGRDVESLDRIFRALAAPAQRGAIAAVGVLAALLIAVSLHSGRFEPAAAKTPEAALQAAMRTGAAGPVLNSYNFGGYLIYSRVPVFIDGRADMYGDALLKRYLDALHPSDVGTLSKLLEDYRIGWTLLEPGTPALLVLDRLPGWRRVYADEVAVVHARDNGAVTQQE